MVVWPVQLVLVCVWLVFLFHCCCFSLLTVTEEGEVVNELLMILDRLLQLQVSQFCSLSVYCFNVLPLENNPLYGTCTCIYKKNLISTPKK